MKSTGAIRKVDEFGRIVIPIELRRKLEIDTKGSIEFFVDGEQVMLRKYTLGCSQCGLSATFFELGTIQLCEACRDFYIGFAARYLVGESRNSGSLVAANKSGREKCHCRQK